LSVFSIQHNLLESQHPTTHHWWYHGNPIHHRKSSCLETI